MSSYFNTDQMNWRSGAAGNQRLDWALLPVLEARQGSNMLPPLATWVPHVLPEDMPEKSGATFY